MTTETPTRRKRRIASDEASSWARNLRLGNPYAKAILAACALYVNDQGVCWPGLATLAHDTDIGEDTILKRLRWLDTIGAIVLSKAWIDDNGVRNKEGRGRPTSSEIRFCLDADPEAIEGAAFDASADKPLSGAAKDAHQKRVLHPTPSVANQEAQPPVSTPLAPDQHPTASDAYKEEELEQEDSPQAPPSGGVPEKISSEARERWQRFKIGYPDGIVDPVSAEAEFHKLSQSDQEQAITAISIYAARCRGRREKSMKAHLFLRKRTFDGLLSRPPETPQLCGPYDPASEAGKALLVLAQIAQTTLPRTSDGRLIYTRPITPQLLMLAQAPRERVTYHPGTQSFGAWIELLRACLASPPKIFGLEAPWPYPPSKDGKIYTSSTGPPKESLMTREDEEHFERTGTL